MSYSRSLLLYQDNPAYGLILKLIISLLPAVMLIASIYVFLHGDNIGGLVLLFEAFIIGLIFWAVFPRKYQVYEDHVRILLGGPFSVKVGFDKIKKIEITSKLAWSANFITRFTKNYVIIDKKRGLSIAITPRDSDAFVENAKEALNQWGKTHLNES